jgi:hypothetical protein
MSGKGKSKLLEWCLHQDIAGLDKDDGGIALCQLCAQITEVTRGEGRAFGVRRLTGWRYGFCTVDEVSLAPTVREQIHTLKIPEIVTSGELVAVRGFERTDRRASG